MAVVLMVSLLLVLSCTAAVAVSGSGGKPAYRDPEISKLLVRGSILDRNGSYLAIQAPDYGFSLHLSDASAAEAAAYISRYTSENAISVETKIERGERFIRITEMLTTEEIEKVSEELMALSLDDDMTPEVVERRKYPYLAATMVGKTDRTMHGKSGIELLYDSILSAEPDLDSQVARGIDITLSINIELQERLSKLMAEHDQGGKAAIISPEGEILAYYGDAPVPVLDAMVTHIGGVRKKKAEISLPASEAAGGFSVYLDADGVTCGEIAQLVSAE